MSPVRRYILPHHEHGKRAHAISPNALAFYSAFLFITLFSFQYLAKSAGLVLGYATDIHVHEIIDLTNKERVSSGLEELEYNDLLSSAARSKAEDMFEDDYWAHIARDGTTPWYFIEQAGYDFYAAGENLARDFDDSESVVRAWMNSPSHKENVLGSYQDIGVAVVNGELAGSDTTLVVQMFGMKKGAVVASKPPNSSVDVSPKAVSVEQGADVAINPSGVVGSQVAPLEKSYDVGEITKYLTMIFAAFLIILFVIDLVIIGKKGITRVSGNTIAHISMLVFLLGALWWINGGAII